MSDLIKKFISVELKARDFGFEWENYHQIIEQINSECNEVINEIESNNKDLLIEELGDLIISTMALAQYLKCDIRECMNISIEKFDKRLDKMIELANSKGLESFEGISTDEMLKFWSSAKESLK